MTLPEPARELWLRTRRIISESLEELTGEEQGYRIGGGTILAARWQHRRSEDIDLTVDADIQLGSLTDRSNSSFERRMEEIGGKPVFEPELNMYQIVFGKQHIDLWARNPILGEGQETVTIDGEPVVVLANAQILRGKLERAELHLVRDAYDIERAATKDPEALHIAMNAMPRTTGEHVAHVWHWNGPLLAEDGPEELEGIAPEEMAEIASLGRRATVACRNALYKNLSVRCTERHVIVERTTGEGRLAAPWKIEAREIERAFERYGLNAHLARGKVAARELREYASDVCGTTAEDVLLYEEEEGQARRWQTAKRAVNLPIGTGMHKRRTATEQFQRDQREPKRDYKPER